MWDLRRRRLYIYIYNLFYKYKSILFLKIFWRYVYLVISYLKRQETVLLLTIHYILQIDKFFYSISTLSHYITLSPSTPYRADVEQNSDWLATWLGTNPRLVLAPLSRNQDTRKPDEATAKCALTPIAMGVRLSLFRCVCVFVCGFC